jgi:hypothetical protein
LLDLAHVLAKDYTCLTCHNSIKISRINNPAPGLKKRWEQFKLDGVIPHQCIAKKQQQTSTIVTSNMSSEIEAIKA